MVFDLAPFDGSLVGSVQRGHLDGIENISGSGGFWLELSD
jgi:hypothetical protein